MSTPTAPRRMLAWRHGRRGWRAVTDEHPATTDYHPTLPDALQATTAEEHDHE